MTVNQQGGEKVSRECEGYRENYEMLLERFPGKIILSKKEVALGFGLNPKTVAKRYPFNADNTISIATLARHLSKGA